MDASDNKYYKPLDAVNSASKLSKVSKKQSKNRQNFYWLAGGSIAVVMVLVLSYNNNWHPNTDKKIRINHERYTASLKANLARLRALDEQKQMPTCASVTGEVVVSPLVQPTSKEMIARQNAPTSMYSSQKSQITVVSQNNQIRQATFAGQGANTQFANANTTTTSVEATLIPHCSGLMKVDTKIKRI